MLAWFATGAKVIPYGTALLPFTAEQVAIGFDVTTKNLALHIDNAHIQHSGIDIKTARTELFIPVVRIPLCYATVTASKNNHSIIHHCRVKRVHINQLNITDTVKNQAVIAPIDSLHVQRITSPRSQSWYEITLAKHMDSKTSPVHAQFKSTPLAFTLTLPEQSLAVDALPLAASQQQFTAQTTDIQIEANIVWPHHAALPHGSLELNTEALTLRLPVLQQPLPLEHTRLHMQRTQEDMVISVNASARRGSSQFNAQGRISPHTSSSNTEPSNAEDNFPVHIALDVSATAINATELMDYWPTTLSPDSRLWVSQNVTSGHIPQAKAHINYPAPRTKMVDATIAMEDVTVTFLPNAPPASSVDATLYLNDAHLRIIADRGTMLENTHLLAGSSILMPDFAIPGIPLQATIKATTSAQDAALFLSDRYFNKAASLGLNYRTISGSGTLDLQVDTPLYFSEAPKDQQETRFLLKSKVQNISQRNVADNKNIRDLSGSIELSENQLLYKGALHLDGVPIKLDITHGFNAQASVAEGTQYHVRATLSPAQMQILGTALPPQITGQISLDARIITDAKGAEHSTATLALKHATITLDALGWQKPVGQNATLKLHMYPHKGLLHIPEFSFKTRDLKAQGSMIIHEKDNSIQQLSLQQFRHGTGDLSLDFQQEGGQRMLNITGKRLDLAYLLPDDPDTPAGRAASKSDLPPIHTLLQQLNADIQLDEIYNGINARIHNVRLQMQCGSYCHFLRILAQTPKNKTPFECYINSGRKGQRELYMHTRDLGNVVRALGITKHLYEGNFTVRGVFDDTNNAHTATGSILLKDYRIKNAPVLGRIVTLASLSGIFDTLTGNGIVFDSLKANFTWHSDDERLEITNGRTHGDALGLTIKGNVLPIKGTLNLNGVLIPSYYANSFIKKIPLIGDALVGGKGEGLIGVRYGIKGSFTNNRITTNPLSLLTPGFLRNVFNIFDEDSSPQPNDAPLMQPDNSTIPQSPLTR